MKYILIALLPCLLLTGCYTLESVPPKPEYVFSVKVDSVPSGASVYAIDSSGHLGRKLGVTPYTHHAGVSGQYMVSSSGKRDTGARVFIIPYGEGLAWKNKSTVAVQLVLIKENYEPYLLVKDLFHPVPKWSTGGYSHKSFSGLSAHNTMAVTVPMTTFSQSNFNRQLEMQQNINIRHEKDSLDEMNDFLDVLLKLNALTPLR